MRCRSTIGLSFIGALLLDLQLPQDASDRVLSRTARGLVACFEANNGALLHNSYDESGTCGLHYIAEESIWVRESNNPTITTIVNDTVLTAEGGLSVDGVVKFIASDGRSCQFNVVIDASDEDVLVRVSIPVLCRP